MMNTLRDGSVLASVEREIARWSNFVFGIAFVNSSKEKAMGSASLERMLSMRAWDRELTSGRVTITKSFHWSFLCCDGWSLTKDNVNTLLKLARVVVLMNVVVARLRISPI